ncbi:hypothetical protein RvY_05065 [Ramazzottius varieornatus]|uniref:Uncharacterized protein n=1 Tax=Ramazzottius varieornatus TaxID=947166 RepID=A0A1D1UTS0_RAMVA|nr:hypothetical protein RvY_05065 [Ramazzottius varieornatus]
MKDLLFAVVGFLPPPVPPKKMSHESFGQQYLAAANIRARSLLVGLKIKFSPFEIPIAGPETSFFEPKNFAAAWLFPDFDLTERVLMTDEVELDEAVGSCCELAPSFGRTIAK